MTCHGERLEMLPGFVPPACCPKVSCEQGRAIGLKRELVGPAKPKRRERSEGPTAVRLADSTPKSGEPATWGSGQRALNCSKANMASMQRGIRPSMQRDEPPTMETGLERIADKARREPKLRFTSLAHHITADRVWRNLFQIPNHSAPGVDGQRTSEAKESFQGWIGEMLQSVHRKGYKAPVIRRVYIPKPGK